MNSLASQPGGASISQISQSKTSFSQRALSYLRGTTETFTNIQVAPGTFNKNLKMFFKPVNSE
jgi:hypothetical protein